MSRLRGLVVAAALVAAPPPPQETGALRERLAEVQARMVQVDQQLAALKKRRRGVLVELQQLALQAEKARAQADGARARQDQARSEVQSLDQRKDQLRQELEGLRTGLRRQVRWMQAMGPFGEGMLLLSSRDLQTLLQQDRYLTWYRRRETARLKKVQAVQGELLRREAELTGAMARLRVEAAEADKLQVALRVQEGRLEGFLGELQQDEGRQQQVQNELAEEALQLERMLANLLGKAKPADRFEPTTAFATLRGKLPSPVAGSLAQGYGEHLHPKYRTRTFQSGLLIQADLGTPVRAVAEGRVIFAEPFQTFGPMVILDHGGGWFSLYAHLQSTRVGKDEVLKAGDALGAVGETLDGPRLAFEIRQGAQPQDPQKWLVEPYRVVKK